MMRHTLRPMLAGLALVLVPAVGAAQGAPRTDITLIPPNVVFPMPTWVEFDAGWVNHGGVSVTLEPRHRNRRSWELFIRAVAPDMGGYGKPVEDVEYRLQGSSTWVPLESTEQLVLAGTGDQTITVYFRLRLRWAVDEPGSYMVPFELRTETL